MATLEVTFESIVDVLNKYISKQIRVMHDQELEKTYNATNDAYARVCARKHITTPQRCTVGGNRYTVSYLELKRILEIEIKLYHAAMEERGIVSRFKGNLFVNPFIIRDELRYIINALNCEPTPSKLEWQQLTESTGGSCSSKWQLVYSLKFEGRLVQVQIIRYNSINASFKYVNADHLHVIVDGVSRPVSRVTKIGESTVLERQKIITALRERAHWSGPSCKSSASSL